MDPFKPAALGLICFVIPLSAAAQSSDRFVRVGECHGRDFVWLDNTLSPMEIAVMFDHLQEMPEGKFLMRFEPDELGGATYYNWGDATSDYMETTYCSDAYYRQRFPKEGLWSFTAQNVAFSGCPEAMDPTRGLASQVEVSWSFGGPDGMFDRFPMSFTMTEIDPLHWVATADAMPQLPGTVNITYDLTATSPTQIDVAGSVDINITGGGMAVSCAGTLEMVGHPVN